MKIETEDIQFNLNSFLDLFPDLINAANEFSDQTKKIQTECRMKFGFELASQARKENCGFQSAIWINAE